MSFLWRFGQDGLRAALQYLNERVVSIARQCVVGRLLESLSEDQLRVSLAERTIELRDAVFDPAAANAALKEILTTETHELGQVAKSIHLHEVKVAGLLWRLPWKFEATGVAITLSVSPLQSTLRHRPCVYCPKCDRCCLIHLIPETCKLPSPHSSSCERASSLPRVDHNEYFKASRIGGDLLASLVRLTDHVVSRLNITLRQTKITLFLTEAQPQVPKITICPTCRSQFPTHTSISLSFPSISSGIRLSVDVLRMKDTSSSSLTFTASGVVVSIRESFIKEMSKGFSFCSNLSNTPFSDILAVGCDLHSLCFPYGQGWNDQYTSTRSSHRHVVSGFLSVAPSANLFSEEKSVRRFETVDRTTNKDGPVAEEIRKTTELLNNQFSGANLEDDLSHAIGTYNIGLNVPCVSVLLSKDRIIALSNCLIHLKGLCGVPDITELIDTSSDVDKTNSSHAKPFAPGSPSVFSYVADWFVRPSTRSLVGTTLTPNAHVSFRSTCNPVDVRSRLAQQFSRHSRPHVTINEERKKKEEIRNAISGISSLQTNESVTAPSSAVLSPPGVSMNAVMTITCDDLKIFYLMDAISCSDSSRDSIFTADSATTQQKAAGKDCQVYLLRLEVHRVVCDTLMTIPVFPTSQGYASSYLGESHSSGASVNQMELSVGSFRIDHIVVKPFDDIDEMCSAKSWKSCNSAIDPLELEICIGVQMLFSDDDERTVLLNTEHLQRNDDDNNSSEFEYKSEEGELELDSSRLSAFPGKNNIPWFTIPDSSTPSLSHSDKVIDGGGQHLLLIVPAPLPSNLRENLSLSDPCGPGSINDTVCQPSDSVRSCTSVSSTDNNSTLSVMISLKWHNQHSCQKLRYKTGKSLNGYDMGIWLGEVSIDVYNDTMNGLLGVCSFANDLLGAFVDLSASVSSNTSYPTFQEQLRPPLYSASQSHQSSHTLWLSKATLRVGPFDELATYDSSFRKPNSASFSPKTESSEKWWNNVPCSSDRQNIFGIVAKDTEITIITSLNEMNTQHSTLPVEKSDSDHADSIYDNDCSHSNLHSSSNYKTSPQCYLMDISSNFLSSSFVQDIKAANFTSHFSAFTSVSSRDTRKSPIAQSVLLSSQPILSTSSVYFSSAPKGLPSVTVSSPAHLSSSPVSIDVVQKSKYPSMDRSFIISAHDPTKNVMESSSVDQQYIKTNALLQLPNFIVLIDPLTIFSDLIPIFLHLERLIQLDESAGPMLDLGDVDFDLYCFNFFVVFYTPSPAKSLSLGIRNCRVLGSLAQPKDETYQWMEEQFTRVGTPTRNDDRSLKSVLKETTVASEPFGSDDVVKSSNPTFSNDNKLNSVEECCFTEMNFTIHLGNITISADEFPLLTTHSMDDLCLESQIAISNNQINILIGFKGIDLDLGQPTLLMVDRLIILSRQINEHAKIFRSFNDVLRVEEEEEVEFPLLSVESNSCQKRMTSNLPEKDSSLYSSMSTVKPQSSSFIRPSPFCSTSSVTCSIRLRVSQSAFILPLHSIQQLVSRYISTCSTSNQTLSLNSVAHLLSPNRSSAAVPGIFTFVIADVGIEASRKPFSPWNNLVFKNRNNLIVKINLALNNNDCYSTIEDFCPTIRDFEAVQLLSLDKCDVCLIQDHYLEDCKDKSSKDAALRISPQDDIGFCNSLDQYPSEYEQIIRVYVKNIEILLCSLSVEAVRQLLGLMDVIPPSPSSDSSYDLFSVTNVPMIRSIDITMEKIEIAFSMQSSSSLKSRMQTRWTAPITRLVIVGLKLLQQFEPGRALLIAKRQRPFPHQISYQKTKAKKTSSFHCDGNTNNPFVVLVTDEVSEYLSHQILLSHCCATIQHFEIEDLVRHSKFRLFLHSNEAVDSNFIESRIVELLIRRSAPSLYLTSQPSPESTKRSIMSLYGRLNSIEDARSQWMLLGASKTNSGDSVVGNYTVVDPAHALTCHYSHLKRSDLQASNSPSYEKHPLTLTSASSLTVLEWTAEWFVNIAPIHITADQRFMDSIDLLAERLVCDLGTNPYVRSNSGTDRFGRVEQKSSARDGSLCAKKLRRHVQDDLKNTGKYACASVGIPVETRRSSVEETSSQLSLLPSPKGFLLNQNVAFPSPTDDAIFPHLRLFQVSDIHISVDFTARRRSSRKTTQQKATKEGWVKNAVNMILSAVGGIKGLRIRLPGQTLKGIRLYQDAFFVSSVANGPLVSIEDEIILDRSALPALKGSHLKQLLSLQFVAQIIHNLMMGGWQGALHPPALAAAAALHAPPFLAIRRVQKSARIFVDDLKAIHRRRVSSEAQHRSGLNAVSHSLSGLLKRCSLEALGFYSRLISATHSALLLADARIIGQDPSSPTSNVVRRRAIQRRANASYIYEKRNPVIMLSSVIDSEWINTQKYKVREDENEDAFADGILDTEEDVHHLQDLQCDYTPTGNVVSPYDSPISASQGLSSLSTLRTNQRQRYKRSCSVPHGPGRIHDDNENELNPFVLLSCYSNNDVVSHSLINSWSVVDQGTTSQHYQNLPETMESAYLALRRRIISGVAVAHRRAQTLSNRNDHRSSSSHTSRNISIITAGGLRESLTFACEALPIILLRSIIGFTEALTVTIQGVQETIDPTLSESLPLKVPTIYRPNVLPSLDYNESNISSDKSDWEREGEIE